MKKTNKKICITNEEKARETIVKMIKEFSKVMSKEKMLEQAWWFDFAGAIHNQKLTEKIMKEELKR